MVELSRRVGHEVFGEEDDEVLKHVTFKKYFLTYHNKKLKTFSEIFQNAKYIFVMNRWF